MHAKQAMNMGKAPFLIGCMLLLGLCLLGCGSDGDQQAAEKGMDSFRGHVADLAEFLTPEEVQTLEEQLARYEQESKVKFLLYTMSSGVLEAMSKRLERRVDLNVQGLNASAFILITRQEREVKIEVNHGLEWQIPDSISNQILDGLLQAFRANQYLDGLQRAFAQMYSEVENLPFEVVYEGLAAVEQDGSRAIGQIVAFEGRYEGQPPTQPGPGQFDPAMHLLIQGQNGSVARVYVSRYMEEMARALAEPEKPARLRARVRQVQPHLELELMALE